jgi:hypothetical protein
MRSEITPMIVTPLQNTESQPRNVASRSLGGEVEKIKSDKE